MTRPPRKPTGKPLRKGANDRRERPARPERQGRPDKRPHDARNPAATAPAQKPAPARPHTPAQHKPGEPQRIAKLLARAGVASRREVERMIENGRIALDGTVLTSPALNLKSLAGVAVDGKPVEAASDAVMYRFHKPAGCLTTAHDPKGRPTIYDLLPKDLPRLVTVGRLDMNTEGLLLLTNDGELKRAMELPVNALPRRYRVRTFGQVSPRALEDLIDGITIEGVRYGPIDASLDRKSGQYSWLSMQITEGKNREVRNVLEHLGLQVTRLIRTGYGPFELDELAVRGIEAVPAEAVAGLRGHLKLK